MTRILFVDDEPRILEALQRLLRPQRREWEMVFAAGGEAALAALAAAPFDVVVTDMRMPGIDGGTLLRRVQQDYPDTIRIVLSGHTELESALRAVPVAHQFLSKPCDPQTLREVVERACGVRALLHDDRLRITLGGLSSLPSEPHAYRRLRDRLANADVPLSEVVQIVEQDMGLCAKLLQLVNSAFFGLRQRVSSIERAVAYLGLGMLKNLVLSLEVFRAFEANAALSPGRLAALQQHGLHTAQIATRLLPDRRQADDAFTAGMLHDIGQLILGACLPDEYRSVLETAQREQQPLFLVERGVLGISHAEVGAYLLSIWGLPYPVVEAVAYHHQPAQVARTGFDAVAAIYVANALAHQSLPVADGQALAQPPLDLSYLDALGVADQLPVWQELARELSVTAREA